MTTLEKAKSKELKEWLRRFNRLVTNLLMMTFAGRRKYTVIDHEGRRSKKLYHTPVPGQPAGENFFIPLPYGGDTDWCSMCWRPAVSLLTAWRDLYLDLPIGGGGFRRREGLSTSLSFPTAFLRGCENT
jgi:hypothetical protein